MNTQESRRSHLQSQSPAAKKFGSMTSKNYLKHAGVKRTNTKSFGVDMKEASSELLSNTVESDSRAQKWAKNTHGWQNQGRARSTGVRTTRQIRRNERERGRKARLNAAFQVLRSVVPSNVNSSGGVSERKMTQVEILRLAKNYISNLTELLKEDNKYTLRAFNA